MYTHVYIMYILFNSAVFKYVWLIELKPSEVCIKASLLKSKASPMILVYEQQYHMEVKCGP